MSKRTGNPKKVSPWKAPVQAKRREEAEARNAKYQALSPMERLNRLDRAKLTAKRERAKIQSLLAEWP